MKIIVFTDIHGNIETLKKIFLDLKKEKYDLILNLGDTISIGPDSNECIEYLKNKNVINILGNHELYLLYGNNIEKLNQYQLEHNNYLEKIITKENLNYIKTWNLFYELNFNNKRIIFSHYLIKNKDEFFPFFNNNMNILEYINYLNNSDIAYYVVGHEHLFANLEVKGKKILFLNSGGISKKQKSVYYLLNIDNELKIEEKIISFSNDALKNSFIKSEMPNKSHVAKRFFDIDLENERSDKKGI